MPWSRVLPRADVEPTAAPLVALEAAEELNLILLDYLSRISGDWVLPRWRFSTDRNDRRSRERRNSA